MDRERTTLQSTLTDMANCSATLANSGELKAAEDLGAKALGIRRQVLGEDYLYILLSLANLATIYQKQTRYPEAEGFQLQAFDKIKISLREDHPWTLACMACLSLT